MATSPVIQTPPPIPTQSPISGSNGLVTRPWISWFTFLNELFVSAFSPALSGVPTTPTAPPLTNSTQIASTAYTDEAVLVESTRAEKEESTLGLSISNETARATAAEVALTGEIAAETVRAQAAEALLAPLASPVLTGTPTVPTAAPGTNSAQVSSTAFVAAAVTVEKTRALAAETLLAPKASPSFTGTVSTAGSIALGTVGIGMTGPNAGQVLIDDNASGGWNFSIATTSTLGTRFWNGAPGIGTQIAQLSPVGLLSVKSLALTAVATASSATAGTGTALPATPSGYIQISINGSSFKIPCFNL